MSRGLISLILTFVVFLVWFYIAGQSLQGIEVAFALGIIIGVLVGLWVAGGRLLRKMHKDDVADAHKRYEGRKEKYL